MTTYVDRIHHGGSGIHVEETSNNGTITFTTKESGTPSEKFRITSTGVLVSADLAMGTNKITGLGAPATSTDAATKGYIDTAITNVNTSIGAALPLAGGTMIGAIAMGSNKITGLGTPSAAGDAATKGYVDTEVANLVDSSPAALDTLNELAAAINDDASFSTTVTNSIATKLPLAGGTMTGNIVMSGTETVDGRDLSVDGAKLDLIEAGATADQTASEIRALVESATDSNVFTDADHTKLNGIESGAEVNVQSDWNAASGDAAILNKPTIPTNNNQLTNGAGYITSADGGNATTLDGLDSTAFLRSNADDSASGALTIKDTVHTNYGSGSTDITGLVSGSTFGSLIQPTANGHLVVGLRDNDTADSFSVVSGGGNWNTDSTYDTLVFSARADGAINFDISKLTSI